MSRRWGDREWVNSILGLICDKLGRVVYGVLEKWMAEYKKSVIICRVILTENTADAKDILKKIRMVTGDTMVNILKLMMGRKDCIGMIHTTNRMVWDVSLGSTFVNTVGRWSGKYGLAEVHATCDDEVSSSTVHKVKVLDLKEEKSLKLSVASFERLNISQMLDKNQGNDESI